MARRLTPEERLLRLDRLRRMAGAGISVREMARIIGISHQALSRQMRAAGIQSRPARKARRREPKK